MPVLLLLISNVAAITLALAIARRLAPNAGFARGVAALLTSYVAVVCATLALLGMACRLDPWWVTATVSVATAALLILRGRTLRSAAVHGLRAADDALAAPGSAWTVALTAAVTGLLTLYIAKAILLATPFVTDDFIYHAPATAHWIQAGRLTLAPQGYHAYFPLLTELFTTWFVLPLHADAFASLSSVAWMLLAAAAIGAIAARLRGSREAGLLAAMCLLAAPAILHGSESFGAIDVAVTALVLAALLFAMPRPEAAPRAADLALSGVAMGLALGCRVTMAPAAVVLAIFAWTASRGAGTGTAMRRLLLFLVAVAAVGGPWYLRNWLLTGNPVFPAALGPFDGPFDAASQDRTRLALRLMDPAGLEARIAMLRSALDWPLPLALLCGAGYVGGLLAMIRGRSRGGIALLWWTGVCLAIAIAFSPFSGTTNASDATLAFKPRFFLAPFAIGLALFAVTVPHLALQARLLVGIAVLWSLAAWRAPAPAWLVPIAAALGVLMLRRMGDMPRRRLIAAALACAPLLLFPLAASKQISTNAELVRSSEWNAQTAALSALEAQPPGLRLARFGPDTYRYYPLFGRRLQFEPVITHADGTPELPLHRRWRDAGPWWPSAPDSGFAAAGFTARLRAQGVELVFIARNAAAPWPPQRDALAQAGDAHEVFVDERASLWRLDRIAIGASR